MGGRGVEGGERGVRRGWREVSQNAVLSLFPL